MDPRRIIYTQYGPLTKGWGDGTPATVEDVHVYVDLGMGPVEEVISELNPYEGKIILANPIPLDPVSVTVDYKWMNNPPKVMFKLNTLGLTLNKWGSSHRLSNPHYGSRHPFNVMLGPGTTQRATPFYIGHRYLGFERAYTSALNSPTTLRLNAPDARHLMYDPQGFSVPYEGTATPQSDDWVLLGDDTGSVVNGDGTYTLVDATAGTYGHGQGACYNKEVNLSVPSTVYVAGRLKVTDYTLNGVFSGVGLGVHDNNRLYLVGLLEVNGLKHVGLLRNIGRPYEIDSWVLGPTVTASVLTSTTMTLPTADVPVSLAPGDRFQVLLGAQIGTYTIGSIVHQTTGVSTLTVTTTFPDDPTKWDNSHATVVFEILWDTNLNTYRMVVDTSARTAQVFVSGNISGTVATLTAADILDLAITPKTVLMLTTTGRGQVFWGSLSREATSSSQWSFYRAGSVPSATRSQAQNLTVATEMTTVPPEEDTQEWFVTQNFGYSEILSNTLLLKSSVADPSLDFTFGYGRIEPYITERTTLNLTTRFKVDSGTLPAGDALITLQDSKKQVNLGNLLYVEDPLADPYRALIELPHVSMSGLWLPEEEGWTKGAAFDISEEIRERELFTIQTAGEIGGFYYKVPDTSYSWDEGGRLLESRFAVLSYTANVLGETGIYLRGQPLDVGSNPRSVTVALWAPVGLNPAKVILFDKNGTLIQDYIFDWTDGEPHTYRLVMGPTLVTLSIDAAVQLPAVNLVAFAVDVFDDQCQFGALASTTNVASEVCWSSVSYAFMPPSTAKRTMGVYLGGTWNDINSWRIPRTDTADVPNSDIGAVPHEIDWTAWTEVLINKDPTWGVSVVFPLEPPPPGYTGAASDFVTYLTNPKAGWINVQQEEIPDVPSVFGSVKFGALLSESITQQWWDYFRYRIFNRPTANTLPSTKMVLNRYNTVSSGERGTDTTVESVAVTSLSSTQISLIPTDLRASNVFVVSEGLVPILSDYWTFDSAAQLITLDSEHPLSGEHVSVTVSFSPGTPTTETYLKGQPLLDSITLLNEGTPPFVLSKMGHATPVVETIPVDYVDFVDVPGSLYDYIRNFSVDNSGGRNLIASAEDGRGPYEIAWEGTPFHAQPALPREIEFDGASVFIASGGIIEDGVLNSTKFAPTYHQGMNRGLLMTLRVPGSEPEVWWDFNRVA